MTNAQFATLVAATGYVTMAERLFNPDNYWVATSGRRPSIRFRHAATASIRGPLTAAQGERLWRFTGGVIGLITAAVSGGRA